MTIGERIKEIRKSKKISVETLAKELGVSKTTIYRYEDSTIEKIPVVVFDKLCMLLDVTPSQLMGNTISEDKPELPTSFNNPQDAMEFIIKTPSIAAYGGYDVNNMSDETIVEFANEILGQLRIVSYKYRNN